MSHQTKLLPSIYVKSVGNSGSLENVHIELINDRIIIGGLEIIRLENVIKTEVRTVARTRQTYIYGAPMGAIETKSHLLEIQFNSKEGCEKSLTF